MPNTKSQPVIFAIFGGTGDLNWRKINPALYNLYLDNWLPEQFAVVGTGRSKFSDADFRKKLLEGVNKFSRKGEADPANWQKFSPNIYYHQADINDQAAYQDLG
jgi:glucose-6-phosphate 1-dehydrogenase